MVCAGLLTSQDVQRLADGAGRPILQLVFIQLTSGIVNDFPAATQGLPVGIAARWRLAAGWATGGPKSLISSLTGASACSSVTALLPVAANRPNSHNTSSGLCGVRRLPHELCPGSPG